MKLKRTLVYGGIGLAISAIIGGIIFFTANLGNNEEAYAATWYNSPGTGITGDWTDDTSWNGSAPPTSGLNNAGININGPDYITRNGDLDFNNKVSLTINGNATLEIIGNMVVNNDLTLNVNGKLIIRGSLIAKNGAEITVNGSGIAQVEGNIDLNNNADLYVDGYLEVVGDVSIGGGTSQFHGNGTVDIGGSGCSEHWTGNGNCNENALLPVELLSFDAFPENSDVIIQWETATELNNDYFTIERSTDGMEYKAIAEIDGNGTTKDVSEYEFVDSRPLNGQSYYRLKQTDYDGTTETFRPVYVDIQVEASNSIEVYPNPLTHNRLYVRVDNPTEGFAYVFDQSGTEIASTGLDDFNTETEVTLPSNLKTGIYIVKVNTGSQQKSFKVIKR